MTLQWKVRNRFKGLDLIDRLPDELWMDVHDIVQKTGIKTIPMEKKYKKAKWLYEEALQIAVKRRCVPFHWGFTLHIASLFQIPQYIASFLSRRHTSCRSVPWRLRGGEIKPVVDDSDILHCMSSAFIETYVCRVCVCVCVCVRACV